MLNLVLLVYINIGLLVNAIFKYFDLTIYLNNFVVRVSVQKSVLLFIIMKKLNNQNKTEVN